MHESDFANETDDNEEVMQLKEMLAELHEKIVDILIDPTSGEKAKTEMKENEEKDKQFGQPVELANVIDLDNSELLKKKRSAPDN